MKNKVLYHILPFLLIAFLNAFNAVAFSSPYPSLDLDSRNYDYLQKDQNRQAVFLQEFPVNLSLQEIFKNKPVCGGLIEYSHFTPVILKVSASISLDYLEDRRIALKYQIFPFHFFW